MNMLRIGEFSILSSISIHMLRHYDEIGLLTPDHVDKYTGYRYYREEQLPDANQILALKSMGFGLKEIAQIQNDVLNDKKIKQLLEEKAQEKDNEIKLLQDQMFRINHAILEIGMKNEYTGYIAVKEIPKRQVVSYRSRIKEFSQEGTLWLTLYEECRRLKVEFSNMEYNIAVLHEVNPEDNEIEVEVQKTIDSYSDCGDLLEFRAVEAVTVASLIFQGGYSNLKDVNEYVAKWILENHYELNGKLFNIYHVSPEDAENENNFITEVCFPINKKNIS
jgi:DNA-binding transcriptional MerR regulator